MGVTPPVIRHRFVPVARTVVLATDWLPAFPELVARLGQEPGARVADLHCGPGWSAVGLAQAYRSVRVDGWDDDDGCVAESRRHAGEAEVEGRVRFEVGPPDPHVARGYDLVTVSCGLERGASRPLLDVARAIVGETGVAVVADQRPLAAVERVAADAGFGTVRALRVEHELLGFYALEPDGRSETAAIHQQAETGR